MGSLCGFAHEMLELGEDLLDRIEVWAIRRQEQQLGPDTADCLADRGSLVAAQVVHDDDVAGRECGQQELFDVVGEALAVDRLVEHARGIDPVAAERCKEGHRAPMPIGHLGMEPLTDRRPATQRRHVGLRPSLVNEDETRRIKPALILLPLFASPGDRWSKLLCGQYAFF